MWNVIDVHAGMAVFFSQLGAKVQMSKISQVCTRAKCVQSAYRCYNLQPEFICKTIWKFVQKCDKRAGFATGVCLQLCVQKCGCAKYCTFTHVRNVCNAHAGVATGVFYYCFVTNCQNTGEPICLCLFTYIQNYQDCSERNCFINQLQFDFKLWFKLIWLNSSFISAWLMQGRNPKKIDCNHNEHLFKMILDLEFNNVMEFVSKSTI